VIIAGQGTILTRHLPADLNAPRGGPLAAQPSLDEDSIRIRVGPAMSEVEQAYIDLVLKHTNNNKTRAAEILGISLRTLQNRVKESLEKDAKPASATARTS